MADLAIIDNRAVFGKGEEKEAAIAVRDAIIAEIENSIKNEYNSTIKNLTNGDGKKWSWYCGRVTGEVVLLLVPYDEIGKISKLRLTGAWTKIDDLVRLFKNKSYAKLLETTGGIRVIKANSFKLFAIS